MFSRISFKSQPDQFQLSLGFSHGDRRHKLAVEWTSHESEDAVLERVAAALEDPSLIEESVRVVLAPHAEATPAAARTLGVVAAARFFHRRGSSGGSEVDEELSLNLEVRSSRPTLDWVELLRTTGSGALAPGLAASLWSALELSYVRRVRCSDGVGASALLDPEVLGRLPELQVLNLGHCNMGALPGAVGLLAGLQELRLVGNRLKALPAELGLLRRLRILAADSNELVILPGELRHCSALEELTLENNRLTSVLLNFTAFPNLQVLHLFNNPLEFLPEISPCDSLRHLSVANMRVTADPSYSKFNVELLPASVLSAGGGGGMGISLFGSGEQQDKLRPIFSLMLRRSSGHHPLLAGALRQVAEADPKNCELMARQENALQQLVLMALNDNPIVVEQTCATLRLLAQHSPTLAESIVENDVSSVMGLLTAAEERVQLASLKVLAAVAFESPVAAVGILTDQVLSALEGLVLGEDTPPKLRAAALEAAGNLAFARKNRGRLQARQRLMQRVLELAGEGERCGCELSIRAAATRVLAVMGENEAVWRAVGRRPLISDRGVRILSMDGGGMKGIATVRMLRELEARTGRRLHEMFDLIVGTSTGGLLAVALGLRHFTLDQCEKIYKVLGRKVFSRPLARQDKEESWMESFYRTFHSKTQHVRAVVVGYKHDAAVYEVLLREYCDLSKEELCLADSMIDTACMDVPKVALVSTLASVTPALPFVFRNYELSPQGEEIAAEIRAHRGSSKHKVWQAVRASSAATYYLDDFSSGGDKFQDGAVVANNPAVVALQEARLLWPGAPVQLLVSIGSGSTPTVKRERAVSSFMETGSILIESACGVERPDEALATLLPLVPGVKYFRFSPLDPRCGMELDEIDPARWQQLEAATEDYIATVGPRLDEAAAVLLEDMDTVRPAPAAVVLNPADALSRLRLGPARHLTLLTAAPQQAQQAQQGSLARALAGVFSLVVDTQQRECRQQGPPRSKSSPQQPARPSSSSSSSPAKQQLAGSGGSSRAAAGAVPSMPSTPPPVPAAQGSSTPGGPGPATAAAPAPAVSQAATPDAAGRGPAAASSSPEEEEDGGGGPLSSLLSWFSPKKQAALPAASAAFAPSPPTSPPEAAAAAGAAAVAAVASPRLLSLPPQPAAADRRAQGVSEAADGSRHGRAGPIASPEPQHASFLSFRIGGSPARDKPRSTGAANGAGAASSRSSSQAAEGSVLRGQPAVAGGNGSGSSRQAGGEAQAGSLQPGSCRQTDGHQLASPATTSPAPGEGLLEFVARQLRGVFAGEDGEVELGACHLALAPAGEGLVLSWRQHMEAVLEPSDTATALLAGLGLDPSTTTLSDLFASQPTVPLLLPAADSQDCGDGNGSSSPGSSSGGQQARPGGSLALLSRQVQWVGGRQVAVLLLQFTLPELLLTQEALEGQLCGTLAQQVVVCGAPIPPGLLDALLGPGGAAAVVCPRPDINGGWPVAEEAVGGPTDDHASAFFFAFYAALKGGSTLRAALDVAESAQPALAGVYGLHAQWNGELVALP